MKTIKAVVAASVVLLSAITGSSAQAWSSSPNVLADALEAAEANKRPPCVVAGCGRTSNEEFFSLFPSVNGNGVLDVQSEEASLCYVTLERFGQGLPVRIVLPCIAGKVIGSE